MTIRREELEKIFDLYEPYANLVQVDLYELKTKYYIIKGFIKTLFLPIHLAKAGKTTYYIGPSLEEPFPISDFPPYFPATFFSLCQVLGFNPIVVMPLDFMYMAMQIQHPNYIVIFDFSPYLEDKIHEGL